MRWDGMSRIGSGRRRNGMGLYRNPDCNAKSNTDTIVARVLLRGPKSPGTPKNPWKGTKSKTQPDTGKERGDRLVTESRCCSP